MPQLTERCEIWRMVRQPDRSRDLSAVYTGVPCLRIPVSSFDKVASALSSANTDTTPSQYMRSEARESTDVFLIPSWVDVRPDDEIRQGRYINNNDQPMPRRYTVDGQPRDYGDFGYQDAMAVFCSQNT